MKRMARIVRDARMARIVRDARMARNMTQQELADAVGISQSKISKFEAAIQDLPLQDFLKVIKALDLKLYGSEGIIQPKGKTK